MQTIRSVRPCPQEGSHVFLSLNLNITDAEGRVVLLHILQSIIINIDITDLADGQIKVTGRPVPPPRKRELMVVPVGFLRGGILTTLLELSAVSISGITTFLINFLVLL